MRFILLFFSGFLITNLFAQDISGDWEGTVWQANSQDTFLYHLHLEQNGNAVSGDAISSSLDGEIEATFQIHWIYYLNMMEILKML